MTKKHFIALAAEIKNRFNTSPSSQQRYLALAAAEVIIAVATQDNPRFDEARFLKACGL